MDGPCCSANLFPQELISAVISSCGGHQVGVTFIVRVSSCIHTAEILKILEYENVKCIAFDLVSFHQIMCAFASTLLHF